MLNAAPPIANLPPCPEERDGNSNLNMVRITPCARAFRTLLRMRYPVLPHPPIFPHGGRSLTTAANQIALDLIVYQKDLWWKMGFSDSVVDLFDVST